MENELDEMDIDLEGIDGEDERIDEDERKKKKASLFKCQVCFTPRPLNQLRRLPLRKEKYEPILWGANIPYEIVIDIIRRLELRRGIRICRQHYPIEYETKVVPKTERIYPIACKLCGRKRPPMMLRNVPSCIEKRQIFYEYASVTNGKRLAFDQHFIEKPRVNLLVCINHFPFPKREVKAELRSVITFSEDGRLRRLARDPPSTSFNHQIKKTTAKPKLPIRCHWCNQTRSPKELRKFPDYPPAQQEFFDLNKGSVHRRNEILSLQQERIYGLKMCYEHFPKTWARARGRFWYKLYFGNDETRKDLQESKNTREVSTLSLPSQSDQRSFRDEKRTNEMYEVEDEEIDVEGEGFEDSSFPFQSPPSSIDPLPPVSLPSHSSSFHQPFRPTPFPPITFSMLNVGQTFPSFPQTSPSRSHY